MSRLSIHLPADWSLRRPPILEILLWLRSRGDRARVLHAIAIDVGTYGGGWWAALRTDHNGELGAINALLDLAHEFRRSRDTTFFAR